MPTLRQLQRTQPDTVLRWFERGRLWESEGAALEDQRTRRQAASSRDREWRPGGSHVDPRAKFKQTRDEKRARFKSRLRTYGPQDEPLEPGPRAQGPGESGQGPTSERPGASGQGPKVQGPGSDAPGSRRGPGNPLGGWTPERLKKYPPRERSGGWGPPRESGARPRAKGPSIDAPQSRRGPGNPLGDWKPERPPFKKYPPRERSGGWSPARGPSTGHKPKGPGSDASESRRGPGNPLGEAKAQRPPFKKHPPRERSGGWSPARGAGPGPKAEGPSSDPPESRRGPGNPLGKRRSGKPRGPKGS